MNLLSIAPTSVFALALIVAIFGFFRIFLQRPIFLRMCTGNSVALYKFRHQDYANWLNKCDKSDGNGLLLFAAGLALALMVFPFLLVF